MPPQNAPERRKNRRYTVVLVPEGETRKSITLSFSLLGLAGVIGGTILLVMSLVVAAVMYTPLGSRLPIHSAELERRYGKQITAIQEQLRSLVQEMGLLRAYNLQLRQALGEDVGAQKSDLAKAMKSDSAAAPVEQLPAPGAGVDGMDQRAAEEALQSQSAQRPGVFGQAEQKAALPALPFLPPVEGFESRGYDATQLHYGVDFPGMVGSVVSAAADGTVLFSGWTYDDGYTLFLGHAAGYITAYKHNQSLLKQAGATVKRGEAIALLGNTGRSSSGPHLHFELWKDGAALDPADYVLHNQ